jgi:hypothetical protein
LSYAPSYHRADQRVAGSRLAMHGRASDNLIVQPKTGTSIAASGFM